MNEVSGNNPREIFIKTLKISNYKGFKACEKEDLSDAFSGDALALKVIVCPANKTTVLFLEGVSLVTG